MKKKPLEYEQPVLHNIMQKMGMDVAAGANCLAGSGPPGGGHCKSGNTAGNQCQTGQGATDRCKNGNSAGDDCRTGPSAAADCRSGSGGP